MTEPTRLRRSTIHDVAREARVSIKTVSRVVRREPNVSDKTRVAVEIAMKQLRYRPTMAARSTVSARSFQLGLIFTNPNAYSAQLLMGAQHAAKANGYHLTIESPDDGDDLAETLEAFVVQSNLAGLIIPPPLGDDSAVLDTLSALDRPFVRVAPRLDPQRGLSVAIDDVSAAREITRHLIELGHRRIAFVKGREGTAAGSGRLEGFTAAMRDAGLAIEDWQIAPGAFNLEDGIRAGETLLNRHDIPTAIFAANDQMAVGVMITAYKLGLRMPQDLSVAGFDDLPIAASMWPPLTTVRQPVGEMGALAAKSLIDAQRGDEDAPANRVVPFELVVRESTGPAKR